MDWQCGRLNLLCFARVPVSLAKMNALVSPHNVTRVGTSECGNVAYCSGPILVHVPEQLGTQAH